MEVDKIRSSLIYSKVFRQDIFQLNATAENLKEENCKCCGDGSTTTPVLKRPEKTDICRIDASEGLSCRGLSVSKDSVFSESSESDDSYINDNKDAMLSPRKAIAMIDPRHVEKMGRRMFSQYVKLYCFNSLKEWTRQGNSAASFMSPYSSVSSSFAGEGRIEIWDFRRKFYIILRDKDEAELLLHMRVEEQWTIDYMSNNSYSCRWTNFNYAASRDGVLERIACTFRQPSHAAEFVARIRNCAIRSRPE